MAENVTYTLLVDMNTGVELGSANLNSTNAPTGTINLLNRLPRTLSKLQSIEIITYVFEDLATNEPMDLSSLSTMKLEGRLINSTDAAIVLDASLTISGAGNEIATAVVDKDIIPAAWTAGQVRLTWTFEDANTLLIFFQDQNFIDPAGTQNGTAVTGFKVTDTVTDVQPTNTIEFAGAVVTEPIPGKALVTISAGTTITAWASFTPVVASAGTITGAAGHWRRVGDTMEVRGKFAAGTTTGSAIAIDIPDSKTLDLAKIAGGGLMNSLGIAWAVYDTNKLTDRQGVLFTDDTDTGVLFWGRFASSDANMVKAAANNCLDPGEGAIFNFSVPISGWTV